MHNNEPVKRPLPEYRCVSAGKCMCVCVCVCLCIVCLGFCDWGLKYLVESLIKYGHVGQFYYVFFSYLCNLILTLSPANSD
jgi:hypothetical protein